MKNETINITFNIIYTMSQSKLPPCPPKGSRCLKGSRCNARTKKCEPSTKYSVINEADVIADMNAHSPIHITSVVPPVSFVKNVTKRKRCPAGSNYNRKLERCVERISSPSPTNRIVSSFVEKVTKRKRCPAGSNYNRKLERCVERISSPSPPPNNRIPSPNPVDNRSILSVHVPTPPPIPSIPPIKEELSNPAPTHKELSNPTRISFLFLTYGSIIHEDAIWSIVDGHRIFVHPKYPEQVSPAFQPYIIGTLEAKTEWGRPSIVNATRNLIRTALDADRHLDVSEQSQWFMLLSDDVYPAVSGPELSDFLSKQTKSMFYVTDEPVVLTGHPNNAIWKASQWWILNRQDALHYTKFENRYRLPQSMYDTTYGAPDETYFLSLLHSCVPGYSFTNARTMYCRWLPFTIQKSPATFNRILTKDLSHIRRMQSLFIRKVSPEFVPTPKAIAPTVVVVYVGTHSVKQPHQYDQLIELAANDVVDVVVFSAVPFAEINDSLRKCALTIHPIIWKFHTESVIGFSVGHFEMWKQMVFLSEEFRPESIHLLLQQLNENKQNPISIVSNKLSFKAPLPFIPLYVQVHDDWGNLANVLKPNKKQKK